MHSKNNSKFNNWRLDAIDRTIMSGKKTHRPNLDEYDRIYAPKFIVRPKRKINNGPYSVSIGILDKL